MGGQEPHFQRNRGQMEAITGGKAGGWGLGGAGREAGKREQERRKTLSCPAESRPETSARPRLRAGQGGNRVQGGTQRAEFGFCLCY